MEHSILYQPVHSKDGNDVTETYCSEKAERNPTWNPSGTHLMLGSWINTNAQVLDFLFELNVPLSTDNAYMLAGLYLYAYYGAPYGAYDQEYDYDYYMAGMEQWSKYEVHFKCVKEKEPNPEHEFTTVTIPYWEWTATATEQPIINSFYVNGLDQEYLPIF